MYAGLTMDDKTTIKELKEKIQEFCELRDWDQYHNAKELSIGIVTEASELLQHFRFKSEKQIDEMFQNKLKKHEISEELVDVLFFILRFSEKYNIDLSDELKKKLEKNAQKYPIEKAKGSNKKYSEYEK
jgi:NTP pyrophosphatase (non-canonical NTP hydrolase)